MPSVRVTWNCTSSPSPNFRPVCARVRRGDQRRLSRVHSQPCRWYHSGTVTTGSVVVTSHGRGRQQHAVFQGLQHKGAGARCRGCFGHGLAHGARLASDQLIQATQLKASFIAPRSPSNKIMQIPSVFTPRRDKRRPSKSTTVQ